MKTKILLISRNSIVNDAPPEGRYGKQTTKFERRQVINRGFINDSGFKHIARKTGQVV